MGKAANFNGLTSHNSREIRPRSAHWKHGASSGDGTHQAKKLAKLAKRGK